MISKQCNACGGYFGGALDGEYLCESCRAQGAIPQRKLASLDASSPASAIGDPALAKRQAA